MSSNEMSTLHAQRLQLEESVNKLRKSLQHWILWYAEYEGLKEGFESLDDDANTEELFQVGKSFDGSLVNQNEVLDLLGKSQNRNRSKEQVISMVSRRMDYVDQNIKSVEKQIASAKTKMDLLDGFTDEDGLPVTEILEELNEAGDVISSSTTKPGETAPELMNLLRKAGLKNLPQEIAADKTSAESDAPTKEDKIVSTTPEEAACDIKPERQDPSQDIPVVEETSSRIQQSAINAAPVPIIPYSNGDDEDSDSELDDAAMDFDESPEDAALRREMLQYSMQEVGAVVAELELDDGTSDISYDDDYDDYNDDDDDEGEEDEYGRSTGRLVSDDYRKQMMELEKKLNAKSFVNVGPDSGALPEETRAVVEAAPDADKVRVVVEPALKDSTSADKKKKPRKSVAFAEELDIAPETTLSRPSVEGKPATTAPSNAEPVVVRDAILERSSTDASATSTTAPEPPKVSRFKSARQSQPIAEPPVVQSSIVERASTKPSAPAQSTGEKPKVSRFKSARQTSEPTSAPEDTLITNPIAKKTSTAPPTLRTTAPIPPPKDLRPAKPSTPKPFSQKILFPPSLDDSAPTKTPPSGPKDSIVASTIIEKPVQHDVIASAPDPDDFDDDDHKQQIQNEFYSLREKFGGDAEVQKEMQREKEERWIEEYNEDGVQEKKVSRFMAKRMM